jgi:chloramphenicol 3-O phosphotransferase
VSEVADDAQGADGTRGRIVVLNGVPRAGKSTIAREMQATLPGVWMNLGVDVFRAMTPARYQPGIGLRPGEPDSPAAQHLPIMYDALYVAIAGVSATGLDVVADVAHHDAEILARCATRMADLPAFFVGVHAPIEVILARRAAEPAGYVVASADDPIPEPILRWQRSVHRPGIYDLELDTSVLDPGECAAAVHDLVARGTPRAFRELARGVTRHRVRLGGGSA